MPPKKQKVNVVLPPAQVSWRQKYPKWAVFDTMDISTHKSAFINGTHVTLDHRKGAMYDPRKAEGAYGSNFIDMVNLLHRIQGDDFYLNEYPQGEGITVPLSFDLDANVPEEDLGDIEHDIAMLGEDVSAVKFRRLRNNLSGKVHLVSNIFTYCDRKAAMTFIRDHLYDLNSYAGRMTKAEWNKVFDAGARGLRAAYSVKVKNAIVDGVETPQVESRGYYVPEGMSADKPANMGEVLWKYSLYNPCETTACFASYVREAIEDTTTEKVPDEYVNNLIDINGKPFAIDRMLIDACIEALPRYCGSGRSWTWTCLQVRAVASLVPDFDPHHFLHIWSKQFDGYNAAGNDQRWKSIKVKQDKIGQAITWLRDRALRGPSRREFLDKLGLTVGFFSEKNTVFFGDHLKVCKKYETLDAARQALEDHIIGSVAYIVNEGRSFYITRNRGENGTVKYGQVPKFMMKEAATYVNKNGESGELKYVDVVQSMHPRIAYERVDFLPFAAGSVVKSPEGVFNTFTGFACKPAPVATEDDEDIKIINEHVERILAHGNPVVAKYILDWKAHILQDPQAKMGVALLFKSVQGTGKNIHWNWFVKYIIGTYGIVCEDMDKLIGRFNATIDSKLLTIGDEIGNFGGAYKSNDRLKSLITQDNLLLERKGQDPITMRDFNNYVFLTNNDWAIKIEASDRRYLCCECSDERVGDKDYFDRLDAAHKRSAAKYAGWLMARDISTFNPRNIPMTDLKKELKQNSLPAAYQYMIAMLKGEVDDVECGGEGHPDGEHFDDPDADRGAFTVPTAKLYESFVAWCRRDGVQEVSSRMFSLAINKVQKSKNVKREGKVLKCITLDRVTLTAGVELVTKTSAADW